MKFLQTFSAMILVFLSLDALWIGGIAKNIYKRFIGDFMTDDIVWGAAFAFYILYMLGIYYFVILPSTSLERAVLNGALLGGLCYATYDLTNWATFKGWSWQIVGIDIVWGIFITAICAAIGYLVFHA